MSARDWHKDLILTRFKQHGKQDYYDLSVATNLTVDTVEALCGELEEEGLIRRA